MNLSIDSHPWGEDVENLLAHLRDSNEEKIVQKQYDLILLSEVLWKDTYLLHDKLLSSVKNCVNTESGKVLLSFAHRPCEGHSPANDLEFLSLAQNKYHFIYELLESSRSYNDALDGQPVEVYLYVLYCQSNITGEKL